METLDFDNTIFFRFLDIIRVVSKRTFTRVGLRDKQSCKHCGRDQHVAWYCEDERWLTLPEKWHNTSLCLECFIALSDDEIKTEEIKILGFVKTQL